MAPPADGVQGVVTKTRCAGHTITYSFLADRPGTLFTYHARYGRDRAASLFDVQRREAGGRARTDDAGQGLFNVPRRDEGPAADSRVGRPARIAVPLSRRPADGSRGMACVEAQLMAECPVIYFDDKGYGGDPPVQRLLRWSTAALAAAAVWVSCICGRRDPDMRRRGDGPLNVRFGGRVNPHVSRAPYFPPP